MAWTVAQVARMSGVTARTLRHYDTLGLVVPAYVGSNGYRYYEQAQLLRLQEVLVLRELGLGLGQVRAVLDGERDRLSALHEHQRAVVAEGERLQRLATTLQRTINHLEKGTDMESEEMFAGFDPARQEAYERELVEDWGVSREAIATSRSAVRSLGPDGIAANEEQRAAVERALVALAEGGAAPDAERVLDVLVGHWELTGRYWGRPPSAEAYAGLGAMYVAHPDFRARYDAMQPGFAEWMSRAVAAYARERLG
jgi:DNA-binding transcriptional MerR regulator